MTESYVYTCIICPTGCTLKVEKDGENINVTGNTCKRGKEYAIAETTDPVRVLTTVMRVSNRKDCMLSVKTNAPIPKGELKNVIASIQNVKVSAPVNIGDVIVEDILKGVDIVATKIIQ